MNKKPGVSVGTYPAKRPTAPAVYRPQAVPKVLQTKRMNGTSPPNAPAVYRPQPVPKVLQTKSAPGNQINPPGKNTERQVAPPVYRPQVPKVLQAKSARPQLIPAKPVPPQSIPPAPLTTPLAGVIQRVTYRGVLYDPASMDQQLAFRAKAKEDLEGAGTWAPGRSENIIAQIGHSTKTIDTVGALNLEEQSHWKAYDVAVNADLQILVDIQRDITIQARLLAGFIPRLKTENVKGEVEAAMLAITRAIGRIPDKWNLDSYGVAQLEMDLRRLTKIEPWSLAATIRGKETELAEEVKARQLKASSQAAVPSPQKPPKPSKTEKRLEKELPQLRKELAAVDGLVVQAQASLGRMDHVKMSIERDIRRSAAEQYGRGTKGHTSVKSSMKKKKFYLGEIETTKPLTSSVTKGRGVLWAQPWAPGVNTAFIEGGVSAEAVYKLKTKIPDNLKQMIVEGRHDDFRAAVRNKTDKDYYPFWQGKDSRFTIYTDELTFLMQRGYRLHEFKKKNGLMQQVMVHPNQLDEVTAAYAGR